MSDESNGSSNSDNSDNEAKNKARSTHSDGLSPMPGALPSEAASRGSPNMDGRDRKEKEKAQQSRTEQHPTSPGALPKVADSRGDQAAKEQASRSRSSGPVSPGPLSSSDREDRTNFKHHQDLRAETPGALAATASYDRTTRKQQQKSGPAGVGVGVGLGVPFDDSDRSNNIRDVTGTTDIGNISPGRSRRVVPSDPSAYQVQAIAVTDDAQDERVRALEAQMLAMMANQASAVPATQVITTNPDAMEDEDKEDDEDDNEHVPCYQKYRCVIMVLVVLCIGGGVAGFLLGQGSSESVPVGQTTPATPAPTTTPIPRREVLQPLLSQHAPLNTDAFNWLVDTDTWEPDVNEINAEAQWVERYAMAVLYHLTGGDEWTENRNWVSPTSVCGWFGIMCQNSQVIDVTMAFNNMVGILPTEIGLLTHLTKLAPYDNEISGSIPTEVGLLTDLRTFEFDRTNLTGTIPTEIGKLTKLNEFFAFATSITGSIPSEIGNTDMVTFEVYNTEIQGNIPEQLWSLSFLRVLKIYDTPLDGSISTRIGQLIFLEELEIDFCSFTGKEKITANCSYSALKSYSKHGCSFTTGTIPSEIGELTLLTLMTAFSNQFVGQIPSEIG
ncbi:MAG: hypothetical protein SGBAC_003911 [Bacillariaceae sp.]